MMFFILTTGRSGSKSVSKSLSQISGCVCFHEPPPELISESSRFRYGTIDKDEIRDLLLSTRSETLGDNIYCEVNQTLSLIVPVLAETFPEAKFIWLLRNGLDQVASAYVKQWYSGHSENHDRYEDCPPIEKAWIDGRIKGNLCGDLSDDEWKRLSRFEKCCWYWTYVNKLIERDLQKYGSSNYYRIYLETLNGEMRKLTSWMGFKNKLPSRVRKLNQNKRTPYPWTEWSNEHKLAFERWCGDLMDQYYPGWRSANGTWIGVQYDRPSLIWRLIGNRQRVFELVNIIFDSLSIS